MNTKNIKLNSSFNRNVHSRSSLNLIISSNEVSNSVLKKVNIDFKNIEFISRAVADELIVKTLEFESKGIQVSYSNLNNSIDNLIKRVIFSRTNNLKRTRYVQMKSFVSENDLKKYIMQI